MSTNQHRYMPEDRAPNRDDILRAALRNPVVGAVIQMWRNDLLTYEEAIHTALLCLLDQNEQMTYQLIETYWRTPPPPFVLPSPMTKPPGPKVEP